MFRKIVTLKISNEKHMSQFKIRKLNAGIAGMVNF
jgi:hypothetical protein